LAFRGSHEKRNSTTHYIVTTHPGMSSGRIRHWRVERPMSGRRQFRLTARTCTRSTRKMPTETPPFWPRYRPGSSAIRTRACRIVWLPRPQIAAGVTTSESDRLVEGANLRISVTRGCRSQRSGPEGRGASRKGARL
jgi:hypothetical protein